MTHKPKSPQVLAIVLALLMPTVALAQQQTIYGPDGRVTGRITTDSQGSPLDIRS